MEERKPTDLIALDYFPVIGVGGYILDFRGMKNAELQRTEEGALIGREQRSERIEKRIYANLTTLAITNAAVLGGIKLIYDIITR